MTKIKAGICGGAGYTAGELLRLLVFHPQVAISQVQSDSRAGTLVSQTHRDLLSETDLRFVKDLDTDSLDILFLCKGHGESAAFFRAYEHRLQTLKMIDLSHDFRSRSNGEGFVYGLPELNRQHIKKARRIANPGCFATCIQLAILPAAGHRLINGAVHVSGITGSTGAGQKPTATSHFSWRNNNAGVYKAFVHQHLAEIGESLRQADPAFDEPVLFIPYRGSFTRGIITTSYFPCHTNLSVVKEYYKDYYGKAPFVHVTDDNPDMKQVVNTNKVLLYLEKHGDQLMVVTVIDNLLKGAAGQAVQNMNLMFGIEEKTGLNLKAIGF